MFLMAGIPLIAQLARNHETELKATPGAIKQSRAERKAQKEQQGQRQPRFTIRIFKRQIPIYWSPKPSRLFGMFRSQTQEPDLLARAVFGDPKVQAALAKQGFRLVRNDQPTA